MPCCFIVTMLLWCGMIHISPCRLSSWPCQLDLDSHLTELKGCLLFYILLRLHCSFDSPQCTRTSTNKSKRLQKKKDKLSFVDAHTHEIRKHCIFVTASFVSRKSVYGIFVTKISHTHFDDTTLLVPSISIYISIQHTQVFKNLAFLFSHWGPHSPLPGWECQHCSRKMIAALYLYNMYLSKPTQLYTE